MSYDFFRALRDAVVADDSIRNKCWYTVEDFAEILGVSGVDALVALENYFLSLSDAHDYVMWNGDGCFAIDVALFLRSEIRKENQVLNRRLKVKESKTAVIEVRGQGDDGGSAQVPEKVGKWRVVWKQNAWQAYRKIGRKLRWVYIGVRYDHRKLLLRIREIEAETP